jgi:hypothetical protein
MSFEAWKTEIEQRAGEIVEPFRIDSVLSPTPKQAVTDYWKFTCEKRIVWYSTVTELANSAGLSVNQFLKLIKPQTFTLSRVCDYCRTGNPLLKNLTVASRSALEWQYRYARTMCDACEQRQKERIRIAIAEQEARQAGERQKHRDAARRKYGDLILGDCPQCHGYIIARLNSATLEPFASCSNFNPYRSGRSCRYTRSIEPEKRAEILDLLAERISERRKKDRVSP